MTRAAIYARISEDPLNREDGVRRQVEDCRGLVESRGWSLAAEPFVDNDVSAYSGRRRDRYEEMLALIESGRVDRVVAYQQSRLWRSRTERAEAIALLQKAKVAVVLVKGQELDFSTAQGRAFAALTGEFDTWESEVKAERVARASRQRAEAGQPNGTRPYGWERLKVRDDRGNVLSSRDEEHPTEAKIVREIVDRLLAGDSLNTLRDDLNARGWPSPLGKQWRTSTLRKLALRESNVARRVYQGKVIGPAAWPAIVDEDKHDRVVALITDPKRKTTRGGQRRHLLTYGIGECGVCGARLRVAPKRGNDLYVCDTNRGCTGRRQAWVDELVDAVMVQRLSRPDAVEVMLAGDDQAVQEQRERAAGVRARLDIAADAFADGAIDGGQLRRITGTLLPELEAVEAAVRRSISPGATAVADLAGPGVEDRWRALPVSRKRAVLEVLGVRVRLLPARQGPGFDPESVEITWRTS